MANEWLLVIEVFLLAGLISVAAQSGFFVPLPMSTVRKILKLAKIKRNDVLYDLGSGDGRVVITATKEYEIRSVGIERSILLYWMSKWNSRRNALSKRVKFIFGNIFNQDLSGADVVVIYLTPRLNRELKPKLEMELKKGTRIVSASHMMEGWKEVKKIKTGHFYSYLYKI